MTDGFDYSELLDELGRLKVSPHAGQPSADPVTTSGWVRAISERIAVIGASIEETALGSADAVQFAINLFRDWMLHQTIVRVIGAGRARIAAAIPAHRLAHGGARVYIQDESAPMPHSIKGGGLIAASASGRTESVLEVLESVHRDSPNIRIVGIADEMAVEFRDHCHVFIGIRHADASRSVLHALADTEEFVIAQLLDAMVVAAGRLAGFDDMTWRIGHENIGKSGPYDIAVSWEDLLSHAFAPRSKPRAASE